MSTKETKGKGDKDRCGEFEPASKGFKEMFKMMSKCSTGQTGTTDCSAMMDEVMKGMMEMCCRPDADNTKEDRGHGKV